MKLYPFVHTTFLFIFIYDAFDIININFTGILGHTQYESGNYIELSLKIFNIFQYIILVLY